MANVKNSQQEAVHVQVEDKDLVRAGKPFPEKVANPDPGKPGHHCIDLKGRYDPTWKTVLIHKTPQTPDRQSFLSENCERLGVKTGEWVDVPPEVARTLEDTVIDRITMQSVDNPDLAVMGQEVVVKSEPRFQYSVRDSA